jgi:DegV family protein with EDD domain
MSYQPLISLDGRYLYYTFLAGGTRLLEHQAELNLINVFPVNDKDTGTNLASTVRSVIDNVAPQKSFSKTCKDIADAALIGARGNSGIIFAQFLHGLSKETGKDHEISFSDFAEGLKKTIPYLYDAVANPVEGTMLTVIKEWSEFIFSKKNQFQDFKKAFTESITVLEKSLAETTQKLEALKNTRLVDAGAKGFVVFIEGIIELIRAKTIREYIELPPENTVFVHSEDIPEEEIKHRYCTEAIIKQNLKSKENIQSFLEKQGDSIVIAGSESMTRIHVHTNNPSELFYELKDYGTITFQKVDDMVRQQDMAYKRKWNIALVTDSTCDLPEEIIDRYQINMSPLNINFGESHFLDKITIKPERFYDLLESEPTFPTTSQINENAFINLYSQLASHYDSIISLHLTGKFSGTFESSRRAAEKTSREFNTPISVIDSKTLSGALGLLVLKAAKLIEEGLPHDEIVRRVEENTGETMIFVSVKTLKYMIKGGRVSRRKGAIANLLGIHPIVSMDKEGNSMLMGRTFSQKANINKVIDHIQEVGGDKDVEDYIVLHAHNEEAADVYCSKMKKLSGKDPVGIVNISPVIGMNAGLGTAAVALTFKK